MPTKNLKLEIDSSKAQRLARAFGVLEPARVDELCENLAGLAFLEWSNWLSGEQRFLSLTEQTIARVAQIYETVLDNQQPK
jgi:hypothetical protein